MNELTLECGTTLHLQPVKSMILLDFVEDGPKSMTQTKFNRMIKYISGWGVTNEIPPEKQDELEFFAKSEHLQRAAWVRMIATESEIAELMALVMALTQGVVQPQQNELEKLRAENERLKAQDGGD